MSDQDPFLTHLQDQVSSSFNDYHDKYAPFMDGMEIKSPNLLSDDLIDGIRMRSGTVQLVTCVHVDVENGWLLKNPFHYFQGTSVDMYICNRCIDDHEVQEEAHQIGMPNNCATCAGTMRTNQVIMGFVWQLNNAILHSYMCIACEYHYLGFSDHLKQLMNGDQS